MPAEFKWTPEAIKAARVAYYAASPVPQGMLNAAVKAQPVVNAPKCPTCGGEGTVLVGVERDFDSGMLEADDEVTCPRCGGSGRERLIPESEIRAWIEERRGALDGPYMSGAVHVGPQRRLLDRLARWLDERSAER